MYIPETLSSNPEWAEWIEQLPDIVAACAKQWDLRIEDPMTEDYAEMSYSYIAPATDAEGAEVVLKIGSPQQLAGYLATRVPRAATLQWKWYGQAARF